MTRASPAIPSRYMQDNSLLRKALGAVVGLDFDGLPAESQLKMMKAMTTTRHKKVRQTGKPHRAGLVLRESSCGPPHALRCSIRGLPHIRILDRFRFRLWALSSARSRFGFRLDTGSYR